MNLAFEALIIAQVTSTENGVEIKGCIIVALTPLEYALIGQHLEDLGFQEFTAEDREHLLKELAKESMNKSLFLNRS